MRRLGIIGGMGPMATADLFKKIIDLTDANSDQEHIPIVIDNYPQIPDRTKYILHGGQDPRPFLIESAKRLEQAGAQALLMPCNTAHYFAEDINNSVNIPLINIAQCACAAIKHRHPAAKRVGLIATVGTKSAKVYETFMLKCGLEPMALSQELEDEIMSCIYDGVKAGKTIEYIGKFQRCVDKIEALGADVMMAGCTEIPLLLPHIKSDVDFVDATLELAREAVRFSKD